MKHFFKYFAVWVILAACDNEEYRPADIGLAYFPLQVGQFRSYQIDEIRYSEVAAPETLAYQLRVAVTHSFPTSDGTITFVLSRSIRDNSSAAWQPLDTWSARKNDMELVVSESNLAFLKLIFPLREGNTWNGNKYNTLGEDAYEMLAVGKDFTSGGTTFENTVTVNQENNDDFIVYLDQRQEVYARNIGLIYKASTQLHYCTQDNCLGQQVVEQGTIFKQQIIEYGDI